jgi:hypothetical protein
MSAGLGSDSALMPGLMTSLLNAELTTSDGKLTSAGATNTTPAWMWSNSCKNLELPSAIKYNLTVPQNLQCDLDRKAPLADLEAQQSAHT